MQEAVPAGQGAMAALIGLELQQVHEICEEVSKDGQLAVPANLNAPGQIVIAGHAAPVRRALEIAKERGASMSVELKVSAPFHCALMQPARDGMEPMLRALKVGEFNFGVIANVTAEINHDRARVVPLLLEQITSPVRWEESMGVVARSRRHRRDRIRMRPRPDGPDAPHVPDDPRPPARGPRVAEGVIGTGPRRQSLTVRLASAPFSPYDPLII